MSFWGYKKYIPYFKESRVFQLPGAAPWIWTSPITGTGCEVQSAHLRVHTGVYDHRGVPLMGSFLIRGSLLFGGLSQSYWAPRFFVNSQNAVCLLHVSYDSQGHERRLMGLAAAAFGGIPGFAPLARRGWQGAARRVFHMGTPIGSGSAHLEVSADCRERRLAGSGSLG